MKIITASLVFLLVLAPLTAFSAQVMTIELNDGSVISGEVVSLSGGVYTVKSGNLGTLKIEESKIKAIRSASSGAKPVEQNSGTKEQIGSLQAAMMNDPDVMNVILSLKDDPKFRAVLQDPDVMQAVQAGDVEALSKNSKFMSLLDDPRVKQIQNKVK